MALAVAHHQSGIQPSTIPGSITLGWTPTPGNLVLVFLHTNIFTTNVTVNTSAWGSPLATATIATITNGMVLGRYAVGGDTSALPALWTAGTTYWAYDVFEISGVSGTTAADIQAISMATNTGVSTLTASAIVSAANNCLAICGAGQYNGSHDPTLSIGWTVDEAQHNNSNYGSTVGGEQAVASSGTSIAVTVTFGGSNSVGEPNDLFLVMLQPSTPTNVNAVGVAAVAVAHVVTPDPGGNAAQAVAVGTAHAVLPSVAPSAAHAAATGHAGNLLFGTLAALTGISAAGHAGSVKADPAAVLGHAAAVCRAGSFVPSPSVTAGHTFATGTPGLLAAGPHPMLIGVASIAQAGQVGTYATPISYLPAARLMRNTPVPAEGAMSNTAVAVVARLYPSGRQPLSTTIQLVGVAARGDVGSVNTTSVPTANLMQAASLCQAGIVTGHIS